MVWHDEIFHEKGLVEKRDEFFHYFKESVKSLPTPVFLLSHLSSCRNSCCIDNTRHPKITEHLVSMKNFIHHKLNTSHMKAVVSTMNCTSSLCQRWWSIVSGRTEAVDPTDDPLLLTKRHQCFKQSHNQAHSSSDDLYWSADYPTVICA